MKKIKIWKVKIHTMMILKNNKGKVPDDWYKLKKMKKMRKRIGLKEAGLCELIV